MMRRTPSRGGSPRLNREINRALVMRTIRKHAPISRADVVRIAGINPNTTSTIVEYFLRKRMLREVGEAPSTGGRPAVLIEINASGYYVIGVEIGERFLRAALIDFAGNAIASASKQLTSMQPKRVISWIADIVDRFCIGEKVDFDQLLGMGVAVPGTSPDGRRLLRSTPLGWLNVPLAEDLEKVTKLKVQLINNSLAISTYHSYFLTNPELNNILIFLITFDPLPRTGKTNMGCGMILNGKAYGGNHQMAGEIAASISHPLTTVEALQFGKFSRMQELLAKAGEHWRSTAIWEPFCQGLAEVVSRGIDLMNPDLTLICSDLSELESLIGEELHARIVASTVAGRTSVLEYGPPPPRLEFETLKLTTAAHGAALPFLTKFEQIPRFGG